MKNDLILFGRIVKVFGENGNIIVKTFENTNLKNGNFLFVEIDETYIPFKINKISTVKKNSLDIKFEFINDSTDAGEIISKNIFIEKDLCVSKKDKKTEIIGYMVVDEDLAELGNIVNVIKNNHQKLLEVEKRVVSNSKSFFIPYVDEFIVNIDNVQKIIYVKNIWKIVR